MPERKRVSPRTWEGREEGSPTYGRRLRNGGGGGGVDERQGLRSGQSAPPLALASPPNVAEVRCRSPFSTKKQRLGLGEVSGGRRAVRSQVRGVCMCRIVLERGRNQNGRAKRAKGWRL